MYLVTTICNALPPQDVVDDLHSYKSPSNTSTFLIHPDAPEDRLNIFSMIWQVQVHKNATDSIGDGVLHQVLEITLVQCISWKPVNDHSGDWMLADADGDTCEMLDDGYVSLKISHFPSGDKLDVVFALGQLVAIYMLKVGNGPDPISPALLKCIINGVNSIVDLP
ncbi:hypothetical protein CY34DRAFT_16842 [Suillus luteus UH-Slu-Lm8-n1]|uniref:Uncharacterized protein n=1 Tax=Suillus luteus UH-Slu-Lm8-n1 TaxID=930992 RepID=A0A0C9ZE07_9AGAM|nr:hypothetical protein CY34DRAFT_16842 [Suillus luteus UH-Slu-Lm8-n1]